MSVSALPEKIRTNEILHFYPSGMITQSK